VTCRQSMVPGRRLLLASIAGDAPASGTASWQNSSSGPIPQASSTGACIMSTAPWFVRTSMQLERKKKGIDHLRYPDEALGRSQGGSWNQDPCASGGWRQAHGPADHGRTVPRADDVRALAGARCGQAGGARTPSSPTGSSGGRQGLQQSQDQTLSAAPGHWSRDRPAETGAAGPVRQGGSGSTRRPTAGAMWWSAW
jgi:hypothetical protein